ncbi:chloride channel protein [Adlercreutzia murintestinalis]|uniref:chloride channel protein n=1 Tax=Adlercreutzia murintestinalis TaxID=2941325 RepID=UPI00204016A1|nr:chloride channel protein [Adlercreutzia murintestinalis]
MDRFDIKEAGKHGLFAVVVGVISAFASIVLCLMVEGSYALFSAATWLVWLLPVFGVVSLLLYRWWHLRLDLTTHRVIQDMRKDKAISPFLAPGILLGTCLSMLGGGSVGKEAGALQIGASLGTLAARPFKLRSVYRRNADESMNGYAAATGMAATFSALFFAPLGSCMFVLELTRFRKTINRHVVTILVACFVAWGIASIFGIGDVIDKIAVPAPAWTVVGQCVVIGVAAALVGTLFDSGIHWVHDLTWRISRNYLVWVIVGGVLFAGLVTLCGWDRFTGSGGNILGDALRGQFGPWDFAVKALLTLVCLGFWFKGGEIMPSFCIGGLLGASCSFLTGGDPAFGAAVGVMGFFAAFSRCPLAAFLMGCEIFGWLCAPYLAIAIFVAYMFGSPVGMYGDGVDRLIRTRWGRRLWKTMRARMRDEEASDAPALGMVVTAEDALRATKGALKDPSTAMPPEGSETTQPAPDDGADSQGRLGLKAVSDHENSQVMSAAATKPSSGEARMH